MKTEVELKLTIEHSDDKEYEDILIKIEELIKDTGVELDIGIGYTLDED